MSSTPSTSLLPLVTAEEIARQSPEAQTIIRLLLARIAEQDRIIAAQCQRISEQDAIIASQSRRIAEQDARIERLEAELAALRKTPRNSSMPPSIEHPHARPKPKSSPSGRKRGGQPGHPKAERTLIPTADVTSYAPQLAAGA